MRSIKLIKLLHKNIGILPFNHIRFISNSTNYVNQVAIPEVTQSNVFGKAHEDLSVINPYFPKSFNIAAYVNNSETLQKLINLKVNLSKIEKKPHIVQRVLLLDFEKNIKKHILFLKDHVAFEQLGKLITKNPLILCVPIEDLQVRVDYLKSKCYTDQQIQRIISIDPFWLMHSTLRIDRRLGFFQNTFELTGAEVRLLSTKQPKIITYNLQHIKTNTFVIKEEMGFEDKELKQLILAKPKLWMIDQKSLLERFNYIHNVITIDHTTILSNPEVLLCRNFKLKQRHMFLQYLGRAQYDPKKENFIPIKALVENTDAEFCKKFAKCNVSNFNTFLKTL